MNSSSLNTIHETRTKDFITYAPWNILLPNSYSSPPEEYQQWIDGRGIFDSSADDVLVLRGKDCLALLHRLSTNHLTSLVQGKSAFTVLTTEKGRFVDSIQILHLGHELHVVCSPGRGKAVAAWIDRYTIREDVRIELMDAWSSLTLGEHATADLGIDIPLPGHLSIYNGSMYVSRSDLGFRIHGAYGEIAVFLSKALERENIYPIGFAALNHWRIEQKIPWWPTEMNENTNPLEAGLIDRISFNKGCYVGQEVIARLDTYEKIQRHLVLLELDSTPELPATVTVDGREIGWITSRSLGFKSNLNKCLAYIKTAFCKTNQGLSILSTNSQQKISGHIVNG